MPTVFTPIEVYTPSIIKFGVDTAAHTAQWAAEHGCTRPLIVADGFNAGRIGVLGFSTAPSVFSEVQPEPDIPNLDRLLAFARKIRPDIIIGFGGGSAMDLAKIAAVLANSELTFRGIAGPDGVASRSCRLVQVPTTAGTGSEVGMRALITDPKTQNKLAAQSRHMLADMAVIDPSLTVTVPPDVTAATGVDALAHCVESCTSKKHHAMIDPYAREGIRLIGANLPRAVADGSDIDARSALSMAAMFGGFCLGPVNTAGGHALAYPLGTRYHIAHGAANALIFPHVLAFNAETVPERTTAIISAMGLDPCGDVFAQSFAFCERLGVPMRLSHFGVRESDLAAMADEASTIRRLLDNNPRPIDRDAILRIYRAAY